MKLAVRPPRGPAGRRAVIAAGVAGLLIAGLVVGEGSDPQPAKTTQRRAAAAAPGVPAETAPGGHTAPVTEGTKLLDQAATAVRQVSYQGVQVVSWLAQGSGAAWLSAGPTAARVTVSHRTGQEPDVVLGLTPTLVSLLRSHYSVFYTGAGSAAGRRASIVEVFRPGGSLAARFWLDRVTKLPLRRELFDTHTRLVSIDDFAGLKVGALAVRPAAPKAGQKTSQKASLNTSQKASQAAGNATDRTASSLQRIMITQEMARLSDAMTITGQSITPLPSGTPARSGTQAGPGTTAGPGTQTGAKAATAQPWSDQLDLAQLASLRAAGWAAPAAMPGGLTLYDAAQASTATGPVVDLAYSDGLSVVSVFVQQGKLPSALPGWRQTDLSGHSLYLRDPAEPDVTWSAAGYVYTIVAGAPAPVLASVVNSLPHQGRPGFWTRMRRGVRRLLSWVDPFH